MDITDSDADLKDEIKAIYDEHEGRYGLLYQLTRVHSP